MAGQNLEHVRSTRRKRLSRSKLIALLLVGISGGGALSGCTAVSGLSGSIRNSECMNDFMLSYRNSALAAKAWHDQKHCFANQPHIKHFEAGFRSGYVDVASGSNGCTPAVAPREYWGWKYQSPEGQAKVAAWFAGYPLGAKAAEEHGLQHWSYIPTHFTEREPLPPHLASGIVDGPVTAAPTPAETPTPSGVPIMRSTTPEDFSPTPPSFQPGGEGVEGTESTPFLEDRPANDLLPPGIEQADADGSVFFIP